VAAVANVTLNVDAKGAAQELNKVDGAAKNLNGSFNTLKATVAALGIGLAIREISKVGEESQKSKIFLQALTAEYGELNKATASVDRIQKLLGLSTSEARQGYGQLYAALRSTGVTTEQLEVLFVGLTKAARLSGAGAAETAGAMLALKQGLASGVIAGENLGSVLEYMPALTRAMTKETDALGLTVNGTGADLKKLGAEGKLTADIVFAAAKKLSQASAPAQTAGEKMAVAFTQAKEKIAEAFGPAVTTAITSFSAAITIVGKFFKDNQGAISTVANIFIKLVQVFGPLAAGVYLVVKAYQAWQLISTAVAATQAFITALTGPQGIAMVAAAGVAAGVAYTAFNGILQGTATELEKQKTDAAAANGEFQKIVGSVGELPNKTKAAADATAILAEKYTEAATQAKNGQLAIESQLKSLELGASVTSARYEAELAFNSLQGQQLERAYELAGSEQERLNIAVALFQNSIQAAKIEYNQALERIKLEQQKLELQYESERLKLAEIEAEGKRAQITEMDAAKRAEIVQRTREALAAQREVTTQSKQMIEAQGQIAQYQEQTAEAQYQSKVLAAQTALEQKLVSDKIGLSQADASRLSANLATGAQQTGKLASSTKQVATNTQSAAQTFATLEKNARNAANAISAAASQQQRLNALQGGSGPRSNPRSAARGDYWKGGFEAFAKGGIVNKPTLGLIGEGGEPEYIVPESKARNFAMNYLMGARGRDAIPGFADGGFVGTMPNITIQTGPVLEQNQQRYVSVVDLEKAMQTMASSILGNIRTNSGRRYVGVG